MPSAVAWPIFAFNKFDIWEQQLDFVPSSLPVNIYREKYSTCLIGEKLTVHYRAQSFHSMYWNSVSFCCFLSTTKLCYSIFLWHLDGCTVVAFFNRRDHILLRSCTLMRWQCMYKTWKSKSEEIFTAFKKVRKTRKVSEFFHCTQILSKIQH